MAKPRLKLNLDGTVIVLSRPSAAQRRLGPRAKPEVAGGFRAALLRLKHELFVSQDQEVAAAIGITRAALNDRKRRGSFPEDKLFALIARRPDLGIDPAYVMTGKRSASTSTPAPKA